MEGTAVSKEDVGRPEELLGFCCRAVSHENMIMWARMLCHLKYKSPMKPGSCIIMDIEKGRETGPFFNVLEISAIQVTQKN